MTLFIKRRAALLLSAVMTLNCVSCAAKVGKDGSDVKRPGWMEEISSGSDDAAGEKPSGNGSGNSGDPEKPVVTTTAPVVTTTTATTTTTAPVMKGNLYDCNGTLLMYSGRRDDGREERFTNDANKVAFANILNKMSGGIDVTLEDRLRDKNPSPVNGDEKVGRSLQLTFNADTQNAVYDYMAQNNIEGAVVVMRDDGSLAAEVSYPSYDPDIYDQYAEYDPDDLPWAVTTNCAMQPATPGSCFKIMSEIISDKHGVDVLYDDGTWTDDGSTIVNWDHDTNWSYPIANRTLYSAFVNSSNIFFAKSFDKIGKEAVLDDLNKLFHFSPDNDIVCDFGSLQSNIEIYCDDDLRRSAFGQSYVRTPPIFLAALGREAIFGDMVRPFAVSKVVDTNDRSLELESGSQPFETIASIPQECRKGILDGMAGVASNLGVGVPAGYQLYAKTGTAETGAGDYLYITGVVKNANDNGSVGGNSGDYSDYRAAGGSYIIVMQLRNASYHNFSFASHSARLYAGIVDAVFNSGC